jgi:hypothetical protein
MRHTKTLSFIVILTLSLRLQASRIVAIGDLHGDYLGTTLILQKADLIDGDLNWVGSDTTLVQVGDQIDRGGGDKAIIDLFEKITIQAQQDGGRVYPLLGNHELMNVELDFRYVFDGGWEGFDDFYSSPRENFVERLPSFQRGRAMAFTPGGAYAKILSHRKVLLRLNDFIFVHGGLTPEFAKVGIDKLNKEVSNWMKGLTSKPQWVSDSNGPFWSRHYSDNPTGEDCKMLKEALELVGSKVMIVAHTVQDNGINSACDGQVIRIDTGISSYYGGPIEALEISDQGYRVID